MSTKEVYIIELDRPPGVSVKALVAYIRDAVEDWGGQRDPDDPLFYPWRRYKGSTSPYPRIKVKRLRPSLPGYRRAELTNPKGRP